MKKKVVLEVQYWKRKAKYFIYATCNADIYEHIGYLYCNSCERIIDIVYREYNTHKDYNAEWLRPDLYEIHKEF